MTMYNPYEGITSTAGYTCWKCGYWIPSGNYHTCSPAQIVQPVIDYSQQLRLIISLLGKILKLLEVKQ
jgi:hypothetical protein